MMNTLIARLFRVIEIMIAVFLGLMILLVFMNVVARYVFNIGFVWSEEIARLCFIFLVYLGSIEAMRDNRHLMVDTVLLKLPKVLRVGVYALTQVGIIWVMSVLLRGAWRVVLMTRHNVWVATGFPAHFVHFFGCILAASIMLIGVMNLVRLFVFKMPVEELIRMRGGSGS
ncbi:MAG: TRAP transporter small permease [Treponema sp.]|nr:TRAP transporter small permease [Treponema sp.]